MGDPVHERPGHPARRRWPRRPGRRGPAPRPPTQASRTPEPPPVLGRRREAGQTLGAYEARYDIRLGYGAERTIILP